ncbi:MAG: cytochrome c [Bdellovibrionales bacterium]|nr:cytochrome c [Bdellovibrionales bacterium]
MKLFSADFFIFLFLVFLTQLGFAQSRFPQTGFTLQNSTPNAKSQKVDPQTLATKATACFACHGETGHSPNSVWPNLAGQKEEYLAKQLLAFKQGTRKDPTMNPVAENLSDQQIQEVALYFSSLK